MNQATYYWWQDAAKAISLSAQDDARLRQSQLTKPPGSLGRLEDIAIQAAGWQGQPIARITQPFGAVFAGDHGVVAQGVSAFPQAVTVEMLKNFVSGGAAVAVLAAHYGMSLSVINCGTALPCDDIAGVEQRPVMAGTQDFSVQAAMSSEQAEQALRIGFDHLNDLALKQCDLFIAGEMGIGNTSCASALGALLLECNVSDITGPGTGLQAEGLARKRAVLERSVARSRPLVRCPFDALVQVGGLEVAAMTGSYIRAAQLGIPSLVDGFIATAAALLAVRLNPSVRDWLLFGHQSAEPGHQALLQALNAKPLVDVGMRVGEGSGAVVALALVQQALLLHERMATFSEAAISGAV